MSQELSDIYRRQTEECMLFSPDAAARRKVVLKKYQAETAALYAEYYDKGEAQSDEYKAKNAALYAGFEVKNAAIEEEYAAKTAPMREKYRAQIDKQKQAELASQRTGR